MEATSGVSLPRVGASCVASCVVMDPSARASATPRSGVPSSAAGSAAQVAIRDTSRASTTDSGRMRHVGAVNESESTEFQATRARSSGRWRDPQAIDVRVSVRAASRHAPRPPMQLTREEIDAMLRRADEARTTLRRATFELKALGEQLLAARKQVRDAQSR